MKDKILNQFNNLEVLRAELEERFSGWSDSDFIKEPSPGKWSASQVVFHLINSEELSANYISKKLLAPEKLKKTGLKQNINSFLLNTFLKMPVKYKAPSVVAKSEDKYSKAELFDRWKKSRINFKTLILNIDEKLYDDLLFKHPFAGRFNIYQTLTFIQEHIKHHIKQIDRIEKHISS
jgi:hypothetical protein